MRAPILPKNLCGIHKSMFSHHYGRPSKVVPISKLELQGSALQCPLLRKKLFSVCHDGVRSLRRVTRQLCTEFTLREELDNPGSYLALRPLTTLHQFMGEEVQNTDAQEETRDAPSFESLESLKVYVTYMYMCSVHVHVWHTCTCVAYVHMYMYMCGIRVHVWHTCTGGCYQCTCVV